MVWGLQVRAGMLECASNCDNYELVLRLAAGWPPCVCFPRGAGGRVVQTDVTIDERPMVWGGCVGCVSWCVVVAGWLVVGGGCEGACMRFVNQMQAIRWRQK
jgi:hypothetical protein